jgi:hypothetical protein
MTEETAEPVAGVWLVNWLAKKANMPESTIRRAIVMGQVKINGQVIDDPGARIVNNSDTPTVVQFLNSIFPFHKEDS